ncbi:MAG: UDP-N-acetylmuramoylalanyl-D-glutamyl-2, 6-diaminopimelate--D-alanyl-D-alanine ligase [Anaerolineaceae bacterium]|nr:UDP-N-acetylmuramoylalanyl-D-glutamyl-2, 6-diaminopimelate--D-alanyl-D-alanine ligase [Anaerolineaceae bacterium]
MLNLADVFEALTHQKIQTPITIRETCIDSRQVVPSAMFVALPGENVDGHDYIQEAFNRGAIIALVQKDTRDQFETIDIRNGQLPETLPDFSAPICLWVTDSLKALQEIAKFWRHKLDVKVIGITGSVGKSTTKELIAEVLGQRFFTLKNIGNLNNEIGLPLTVLRLEESHQRAVLEMGFYVPGEIKFLCEIASPEIGVITNVGTVHAERAGSQEAIARGKAELVESLPQTGVAILNLDDPFVAAMAHKTNARIFTYGLDQKADLWADQIEGLGLQGIRFRLHYRKEILYVRVPLIGRHSVHTALRAAAVGLVEGLTWQEIIRGLQKGHTQLRLAAVTTKSGALILDDTYNASPDSMLAALNLLSELQGNKCAVLGEMLELGQYEAQGHEMVGVRAAQITNRLITVGERAKIIAQAAQNAGLSKEAISWVPDVPTAINLLKGTLKTNDVVLIKGSHGLHMERIVAALEVTE